MHPKRPVASVLPASDGTCPETARFRDDRTLGISWLLLGCEAQCWRRPRPSVSAYSKAANTAVAKMRLVAICCAQHMATYVARRTMLRTAASAKAHLAACVLTAACEEGGVSDR